jgi:hypothetical protein
VTAISVSFVGKEPLKVILHCDPIRPIGKIAITGFGQIAFITALTDTLSIAGNEKVIEKIVSERAKSAPLHPFSANFISGHTDLISILDIPLSWPNGRTDQP